MEAALCGCNCPRCGIIVASRTDKALPSGRTFTFYTCPRCHQILATAAEDKYDADRSLDYAKPFVYGRSLVYLPGDWRRLPVIQPITDEILAKIRSTFVPRENDIWLTTYPKCGTTWIQNVLSHLVYSNSNTGPVQVGLQVTDDVIWMDALCGIHGVEPIMAHVNTMPTDRPRMFKSHAPIGLLEPTVSSGAKVVHVARNCKGLCFNVCYMNDATPLNSSSIICRCCSVNVAPLCG